MFQTEKNKLSKPFILFSLLITLLLSSCSLGARSSDTVADIPRIPVKAEEVFVGNLSEKITTGGKTQAKSSIMLFPKIAGAEKVTGVFVKEGDRVHKGQVLITLDQLSISVQLKQAELAYQDAQKNYERNLALFEAGAIPEAVLEQVRFGTVQAEAAYTTAKLAFDNTIITSPLNGIVASIDVEEGMLVTAQAPVATCTDLSDIKVQFYINESKVNHLKVGEIVEIHVPAADNAIFEGKIATVSPLMDEMRKAYPVEAVFANKDGLIKQGMYAHVGMTVKEIDNALIAPIDAIVHRGGETFVFIYSDDEALLREVETGFNDGNNIEILAGLEAGEYVITAGKEKVINQSLVIAVNIENNNNGGEDE